MSCAYYQVVSDFGNDCHAGPKAQRDVATILRQMNFTDFAVNRRKVRCRGGFVIGRILWFFDCWLARFRIAEDSVFFLQYPSAAWSKLSFLRLITPAVKRRRKIKLISIFHDLSSLRWGNTPLSERKLYSEEIALLELSDVIIVHNTEMMKMLAKRGIPESKMLTLGAFDYFTSFKIGDMRHFESSVVIAGCLSPDKVGYLDCLSKIKDVQWNLYGVKFDRKRICGSNISYNGCFSPEELPSKIKGSFGLIWDGPTGETCAGDLGNYLRINSPHKLSLYIVSGLPILIWDKAAMAGFVREHGIGFCIGSLDEIPCALRAISSDEYSAMCKRVARLADELRQGMSLSRVVGLALANLEK